MRRNHKAVALGAFLVMVCSCTVMLLLLSQCFSGTWSRLESSQSDSSAVAEESRDTTEAEIVTPSAVTLEEDGKTPVYSQVPKPILPTAAGCNAVSPQQGRDSLTDEGMAQLYDAMSEKAYRVSETAGENQLYPIERITVRGSSLTDGQVVQTLTAFSHDHPEVFWISNRYGYSTGENRTVVQLYAVASASECQKLSKRVMAEAEKVLQKLPEGANALEKEITLYKTIIQNCQYDDEGAKDDQDWRAHSIVGAFLDGEAVCEGYSRALQLLLNRAGIASMVVTGTAGGAHMWNLVCIDGQWYQADATWDDYGEEPLYRYLNLTDEMMGQDHQLYPQANQTEELKGDQVYNLPLPTCTATKANYFQAKGVLISSFEDIDPLVKAISQASQNGEKSIQLYITEDLDYDAAIKALFLESPYQFLNAVQQANLTANVPVDYNHCTYVEAKTCRGVVVLLSYEQGS